LSVTVKYVGGLLVPAEASTGSAGEDAKVAEWARIYTTELHNTMVMAAKKHGARQVTSDFVHFACKNA
jgi:hypothetical protein